jgi:hypothetical protein
MVGIARRADNLVVERLSNDSLVVYDHGSQTAHALNGAAVWIWDALDGHRTPAELAQECKVDERVAREVLDRLDALDLLEPAPGSGVSRRSVLGRAARIGGVAALAAPLITSVAVPPAAMAASTCGAGQGVLCVLAYTNAHCIGKPVVDVCTADFGASCTCHATTCVTGLNGTSTKSGTCGV